VRTGSVFSGDGLLDFGLSLAGFEHVWFCEFDAKRREILQLRWPGATVHDDIRELTDPESVECIVGGFPCKGVSSAGKGEGFDHPETALWREMRRVIRLVRPRYVLMENVAVLTSKHDGRLLGEVLRDLAESGFDCFWDCIPASALGAPHGRDRIFIVAHARGGGTLDSAQESDRGRAAGQEALRRERGAPVCGSGGCDSSATDADWPRRGQRSGSLPAREEQPPAESGASTNPERGVHGHTRRADFSSEARTGEGKAPERQRLRSDAADGSRPTTYPASLREREQTDTAHSEPRGGYPRPLPSGRTLRERERAASSDSEEQRHERAGRAREGWPRSEDGGEFDFGIYQECVERWAAIFEPPPEPLLRGVDARAAAGVVRSRLSALGDGVQVQVAEFVGRRILERERGSTFANQGKGLARTSSLSRSSTTRRRPISPASTAQRVKVRELVSIVSGKEGCDPAHIWPRSQGGCDDPLCVVPLTREEHDAYDAGQLDLNRYLLAAGCIAEFQHALGHADGSLVRLLERVTGQKWSPRGSV